MDLSQPGVTMANMSSSPDEYQAPRRPAFITPAVAESLISGWDPAERIEAAHSTAEALVRQAGSDDGEHTARLVALTDEVGLGAMADLWSDRPADTLPGALWRLYSFRDAVRRDPENLARAFDAGRDRCPVFEVVAGVGSPGPEEVLALGDIVLTGAFRGDLGVALERASAFCRVVSVGWAVLADDLDADAEAQDDEGTSRAPAGTGVKLTRLAADLVSLADELDLAANRWRTEGLH